MTDVQYFDPPAQPLLPLQDPPQRDVDGLEVTLIGAGFSHCRVSLVGVATQNILGEWCVVAQTPQIGLFRTYISGCHLDLYWGCRRL